MQCLKTSCVALLFLGLPIPMMGWATDTRETGAVEMSSEGVVASVTGTDSVTNLTSLGMFRITVHSEIIPIPMNQMHSWIVHLETPDGQVIKDAEISVSGGMPAHQHGLPTEPRVTGYLGNGDYLLEGMKFSMAGEWRIRLDIAAGEKHDKLKIYLELP